MSKKMKLTEAQRICLQYAHDFHDESKPSQSVPPRAAHGAWIEIAERGWTTPGQVCPHLTAAGRAALRGES